jgi:hypothetical protein
VVVTNQLPNTSSRAVIETSAEQAVALPCMRFPHNSPSSIYSLMNGARHDKTQQ